MRAKVMKIGDIYLLDPENVYEVIGIDEGIPTIEITTSHYSVDSKDPLKKPVKTYQTSSLKWKDFKLFLEQHKGVWTGIT